MQHATPRLIVGLASAAALLTMAACGSTPVEDSTEYTDLVAERDALTAELAEANAEIDDLDDQLAVAEARLSDVNAQIADADADAAEGDDLVGYHNDFLVIDLVNRAGFSAREADCVSQGLLADPDARDSYLLLIDPGSGASGDVAQAALDEMTAVMDDCGIDVADEPQAAGPPLDDVLGEVEVSGVALPEFDDGLDTALGVAAPVLVGADYDDQPVTVDASADGPTMLIFLAHWCPHCNAELPKLNQLRDEGRIPDGVNIVAVSSLVSPDRANYPPDQWLADAGWTFPTVVDEQSSGGGFVAADAFGLRGVPYTILIDGDGLVTARWAGERPIEAIEGALLSLAP